jgi:hypothetical protein
MVLFCIEEHIGRIKAIAVAGASTLPTARNVSCIEVVSMRRMDSAEPYGRKAVPGEQKGEAEGRTMDIHAEAATNSLADSLAQDGECRGT